MRSSYFALALLSLPLLCAGFAASQEPRPKVDPVPVVGERAPSFRLNDHTGRAVELPIADDATWTVVAFFPKAATPG